MSPETIWVRYYDLLLRRAERLLNDSRVAIRCAPEDLVMDTMARAVEAAEQLRTLAEPQQRAYLFRTQDNLATDKFREHVLAECRSVDREQREQDFRAALHESAVGLADMLAADQTSPSQGAIRNEQEARLVATIAGLPERQRDAITLHRQGVQLAGIAAHLNTTTDGAAGLIHRALKALRAHLNPDANGSGG